MPAHATRPTSAECMARDCPVNIHTRSSRIATLATETGFVRQRVDMIQLTPLRNRTARSRSSIAASAQVH